MTYFYNAENKTLYLMRVGVADNIIDSDWINKVDKAVETIEGSSFSVPSDEDYGLFRKTIVVSSTIPFTLTEFSGSGKFILESTYVTPFGTQRQIVEFLVTNDGVQTYLTQYASVRTGVADLFEFDAVLNASGKTEVVITPTGSGVKTYKISGNVL